MSADLCRFWFKTRKGLGIGVTAYSLSDAHALIAEQASRVLSGPELEILEVTENVDVRSLDQAHVIPNMSPPTLRGVWFPLVAILR